MSDQAVLSDRQGAIRTITLNAPRKLNALSRQVLLELEAALDECALDPETRVLVLTGAGRGFCAGADLSEADAAKQLSARTREDWRQSVSDEFNVVIRKLRNLPVPTIAAVNGVAAGGGYGLALTCDVVIAVDTASFVLVFTPQLGLIPDMGSTWHAARNLGRARAMASAFFGDCMPAEIAADLGLIWKAVPQSAFAETVDSTALMLSAGPTRAYAAVRQAMDSATRLSLEDQLDLEADLQSYLLVTEDYKEAVRAFREKRKPVFKGE
jgi:2-(1,2-epoxy-1,2-dihydrophenyl)acetyl-CoA isomerase